MTTLAFEYFLKRLLLRSALSDAERRAVLSLRGAVHQIRANHSIVRPGDCTDTATLVANGLIARYDAMRDGNRQTTAIYVLGDMCDLYSVVAPLAGWGLTALSRATIVKVPHEQIQDVATRFPRLAFAFWRDTVVDASVLAKWVGNLGRKGAQSKLAHLICEMGLRLEIADLASRDNFQLDLSQAQIADVVGLTSVHVNRTFQELRRQGLIQTDGRYIYVPNWEHLSRVAEFDPTYLLLSNAGGA